MTVSTTETTIKLEFRDGPLKGRRFQIEDLATVGRDVSNDIVIDDPAVSLVHCELGIRNGEPYVKDLGSTNGSYVNDMRVISSVVYDGDILSIAGHSARFDLGWRTAPKPGRSWHVDVLKPTGLEPGHDPGSNIFGTVSYYLRRKIADGGMGAVYEAEQFGAEGFIKKVAIKIILPKYARSEQFVSAFIGEAKLVANLVHQNIVQIHHLGRHERGYYIAMEYIDGITLTELMALHRAHNRVPDVEMCTFIISRIARGLEYAHNKRDDLGRSLNLVHRDVSPRNIMITVEGETKLTDFGVARAANFMDDTGDDVVGCVEFMAPEQAASGPVDGRSDIFSLGLVYFELLTGKRVFQSTGDEERDLAQVQACVIPDPREFRSDLPDEVAEILLVSLRRNPDERFLTTGEFGSMLERHMYSSGLGPTIVTLAKYVHTLRTPARNR